MDHHRAHPAKDVQPEDGFDEGQRDTPRRGEDEAEPRFSRGQEKTGTTPEKLKHEDFARGQDSDLPTPEKEKEGRFSEGQEKLPDDHEKEHPRATSPAGRRCTTRRARRCAPTSLAARTRKMPIATRFGPTTPEVRTTTSDRLDDARNRRF